MSKFYKIPCVWQMYGYHDIEANSVSEAIEIALSDEVGLPDGEYLPTTFEVDTASELVRNAIHEEGVNKENK
jgi:hypothetical protein